MQTWRATDESRVILLVVAQNAVAVSAEDDCGAVEFPAGYVVRLKAANVIESAVCATRCVDA